jgi:hypothetical protein
MTRDEIAQALASIGQHHARAQREILQLALRLQNEGLTEPARDVLPDQHVPSDSTQEDLLPVVPPATEVSEPHPRPTREQALATAKEVLREQLKNHNQPYLLHLVERVEQSDVDAVHHAAAFPTPVAETSPLLRDRANMEFFRGFFNAQTITGGRGPIGKGVFGLKQYEEDVRVARQTDLRGWPSGFYTDHATRATQFMLNQVEAGWAILIEGLARGDIHVSLLNYNEGERARFTQIAPDRLDRGTCESLAGCFKEAFYL